MNPSLSGENKFGTMPIGKLLFNTSLPLVLSMLVQALYNLVDSIFVARLGEAALSAVSLVTPIQFLMIAVSSGTAVGISSLFSRRLGEKKHTTAHVVALNGHALCVLSWVCFALFGGFFSDAFFAGYSETDAAMAAMGVSYMSIVSIGSLGVFLGITFERLLQASGLAVFSMYSQMLGAVINIILDPILIFGLFGLPAMGVAGAAVATVIGQFGGMLLGFYFNLCKNKQIRYRLAYFRLRLPIIRQIYSVGIASILTQSINSAMLFFLNGILISFGTTAVSVFGICYRLQSFVTLPLYGITNAALAIFAYNYGARKPDRLLKTLRLTLITTALIMFAGTLLLWIMPQQLLVLFNAQSDMLAAGVPALRITSLAFPLVAVTITFTAFFHALGQATYSIVMTVVRQLVFMLPLAYLFASLGGLFAFWFSLPIAEVASALVAAAFFRLVYKKQLSPLIHQNETPY